MLRALQDIFRSLAHSEAIEFQVSCSFVQIYNESCFDMLRDPNMLIPLAIRELASGKVYVQSLSEYSVKGAKVSALFFIIIITFIEYL